MRNDLLHKWSAHDLSLCSSSYQYHGKADNGESIGGGEMQQGPEEPLAEPWVDYQKEESLKPYKRLLHQQTNCKGYLEGVRCIIYMTLS